MGHVHRKWGVTLIESRSRDRKFGLQDEFRLEATAEGGQEGGQVPVYRFLSGIYTRIEIDIRIN